MELFQQMAGMGHERILFCSNPQVGLQAIIAVHSTVLGPGLGGVRMWPYQSMDEALTDVLRLSRGDDLQGGRIWRGQIVPCPALHVAHSPHGMTARPPEVRSN